MTLASNHAASCPYRWFGLPHKWRTFYWDKFGTGRRDVPIKRCKFCREIRRPQ